MDPAVRPVRLGAPHSSHVSSKARISSTKLRRNGGLPTPHVRVIAPVESTDFSKTRELIQVKRPERATTIDSTTTHAGSSPSIVGDKYAFVVGINYLNCPTSMQLAGCANDALDIVARLMENYHVPRENIRVLCDDELPNWTELGFTVGAPTNAAIKEGWKWLVGKASSNSGNSLFFSYSGHGSQVIDRSGDELSGFDETLVPCDFYREGVGMILDDEVRSLLVNPLPSGCHLTAVIDACHSETVMDLRYKMLATHTFGSSDIGSRLACDQRHEPTQADVVLITGCMDSGTAADAWANAKPAGALTACLLAELETAKYRADPLIMLVNIRTTLLENGFDQVQ